MGKEQQYFGPESRNGDRRKSRDRRDMFRWEPEKTDRRNKKQRRKGSKSVWDEKVNQK